MGLGSWGTISFWNGEYASRLGLGETNTQACGRTARLDAVTWPIILFEQNLIEIIIIIIFNIICVWKVAPTRTSVSLDRRLCPFSKPSIPWLFTEGCVRIQKGVSLRCNQLKILNNLSACIHPHFILSSILYLRNDCLQNKTLLTRQFHLANKWLFLASTVSVADSISVLYLKLQKLGLLTTQVQASCMRA